MRIKDTHSSRSDLPPPQVPLGVVEWLERLFPLRSPDLSARNRETWFAAGQQSVVARLRLEFERQTTRDEDD